MNFGETIVAIVVGWSLGTTSTWLILAKPWLDRRMLPKQGSNGAKAGVTQSQSTAPVSINTGPVKIV